MNNVHQQKIAQKEQKINDILQQMLNRLKMGNVYRSVLDRPINDKKYDLWSYGETIDAFDTTTAAWDIFDPVNG